MRTEKVPVLIVGGGIVGLSASLFLSRAGVPSLLVERRRAPSVHPRSRGVNARTMELYREVGVEEAVRAAGKKLAPALGWYEGPTLAEVIGPQPRREGVPPSPFSHGTLEALSPVLATRVTQDRIEPVLLAAAREAGGQVRFATELVDFSQAADGVRARVRDVETGEAWSVEAEWMIAADGAHSGVRAALGLGTTGRGSIAQLLNVLFQADLAEWVRDREFSGCVIDRPEVRGIFLSIDNASRWVFHMIYDPARESPADYPLERCRERVALALGLPAVEVNVERVSPWDCAERVAEHLRAGRVFLAGDAAHQMPPWGGQGANTGVHDVHNLAWKLAAVRAGWAGPALLESYEAERLPVARVAARESADAADARGLPAFGGGIMEATKKRFGRILGFGTEYRSGALQPDGSPPLEPQAMGLDGRPGTRAPHVWLEADGGQRSTLSLFGRSFVLLAGPEGQAWCEAARALASAMALPLEAHRVGPGGELAEAGASWCERSGIGAAGAVLVRPDGIVGFRAREGDPRALDTLRAALERCCGLTR